MTVLCQGPDPAPRRPRQPAPPGACDCHAHVFGPVAQFPFTPERRYTPPEASVENYRRMLDTLGIERAVIVQPSVYGTDNRATLAAIGALGPAGRGIAVVEASVSESELARLDAAGMRGVRLNLLFGGGPGLEGMAALADRIKAFGWHLQLLVDARDLPALRLRLEALPVAVVIDHMGHMNVAHGLGHPGFQELLGLLREGRTWVKLSGAYRISAAGPPFADVAPVARALIEAAPTRVVWGTDWPHPAHEGPMPNDGELFDLLAQWAPEAELRRAILVDNPAALYGFDRGAP